MAEGPRSTIELDDAPSVATTRREWIAERIGWCLIGAVLGAAVLGLLGPGPLSHRRQTDDDGRLAVEHYAVQRYAAPAELQIRFRLPQDVPDEQFIRLSVSRSFTDHVTPETITPQPAAVEMQDDRLIYSFRTADLRGEGRVIFRHKYDSYGWLRFKVGLPPGPSVAISQFVWP